jgi:hypothetical protein
MWSISTMNLGASKFGLALESEKLFAGVVPQVSLASRSNPKNYLPA